MLFEMILLARRAPSATVGIRGTKLRAAIVLQREDATAKPKILPPFCAESRAKNHIMIYCLVMLKVMGLQIDGSSSRRDGIACQWTKRAYYILTCTVVAVQCTIM